MLSIKLNNMKKIFIAIGLVIIISILGSTMWDSPQTKVASLIDSIPDRVDTVQPSDDIYESEEEPEMKYYYKGKEISKEQYEAYQVQIQALQLQVQVLKAAAEEYDRNTPNVTYRRYSDGRVETRIDR